MDNQILWKANTSFHDWNDGHFIHKLLKQVTDMGLSGQVTWLKAGIRGIPQKIILSSSTELLDHLAEPLPDEPPHRYLEAGGEQPWSWSVKISIAPFEKEEPPPQRMSSVWLFFDRQTVSTQSRSQELFQAFRAIHDPDNTEYALIHPYQHWLDFANRYYQLPVTIGPMFKGMFWANFWGPGHLTEFDLKKLHGLSAYEINWVDDTGLFLRVAKSIIEVEKPTAEEELLRLTKAFSDAKRTDSKWK